MDSLAAVGGNRARAMPGATNKQEHPSQNHRHQRRYRRLHRHLNRAMPGRSTQSKLRPEPGERSHQDQILLSLMHRPRQKVGAPHRRRPRHHRCHHHRLLAERRIAGILLYKTEALNRPRMQIAGISPFRIEPRKSRRRLHLHPRLHHKLTTHGEYPYRQRLLFLEHHCPAASVTALLRKHRPHHPEWQEQAFPKIPSWTDCPMFSKKGKQLQRNPQKNRAGICLFRSA